MNMVTEESEGSTHEDIEEFSDDIGFMESRRKSTRYTSTTNPSTLEQMTRKREAWADATSLSPELLIYAWLADTEPPKDPDSVLK